MGTLIKRGRSNLSLITRSFPLLCLLLASHAVAQTCSGNSCTAASLSCTDIQAAINAAPAGGIVNLPAGSFTWTGTGACVSVSKYLSVIGAGIGNTIITDNENSASSGPGATAPISLGFTATTSGYIRWSGMTFLEGQTGRYTSVELIHSEVTGTGTDMYTRIDHVAFNGTLRRCLWFAQDKGLVDHNQFTTCDNMISSPGDYDAEWQETLALGSNNAIYFENNTFTYCGSAGGCPYTNATDAPNIIDCQYGARYVSRYNAWIADGNIDSTFIMNHGYDSVWRGCMSIEAYNDTMTVNQASYAPTWAIQFRGGTGVVFNETIVSNHAFGNTMAVTNYRSSNPYTAPGLVGYYTNGPNIGKGCLSSGTYNCAQPLCGSSQNGIFDGPATLNYPCRDQIGRGGPDTCEGTSANPVASCDALIPLYEWNNTLNGSPVHFIPYAYPGDTSGNYTSQIVEGQDYYNGTVNPTYTPYTYPHPLIGQSSGGGSFFSGVLSGVIQ